MKSFFNVLRLFFVIAGAVMGAGFLSGGELILFFRPNDLFCLMLSGAVFMIGYITVLSAEETVFFRVTTIAADVIFAAASLSGIETVFAMNRLTFGIPVASVTALTAFALFFSSDVKAVERANVFIMPFSVIAAVIAAIRAAAVSGATKPAVFNSASVLNAVLYAFINVFVTVQTVKAAAKGRTRAEKVSAFSAFSVVFVLVAFIILFGAKSVPVPILAAESDRLLIAAVSLSLVLGSFTSFICFMYPVKRATRFLRVKGKTGKATEKAAVIALYVAVFLLSRIEFYRIVKYLYPIVGGFGCALIVKCAILRVKCACIKAVRFGDTMKKNFG